MKYIYFIHNIYIVICENLIRFVRSFDKHKFCENKGPPRIIDKEIGRGTDPISRYVIKTKEPRRDWDPPIMRKPRGGFLDMEGNNEEKEGAV